MIRQKALSFFVQFVHFRCVHRSKTADGGFAYILFIIMVMVLVMVLVLVTPDFPSDRPVDFPRIFLGQKETVDFSSEVAYYNLSQINAERVRVEQNEKPRRCHLWGFSCSLRRANPFRLLPRVHHLSSHLHM